MGVIYSESIYFFKKMSFSESILFLNVVIKGALDNFSLIPQFFFKKVEIFTPLEVYIYVVTAYFNLTCNFNLITKIWWFSCSGHF